MTHSSITLTAGFSRFEAGSSPCKQFQWFMRRLEKPLKRLKHSTFRCALLRQCVHEIFRWRALILWLPGLTVPLFAAETHPLSTNAARLAGNLAELQTRIAAHISRPSFAAAAWGVKVVSLDTGKGLYERNAGKLLKPASNAKLFTGALALDRLGPDYRIKTSCCAAGKPDGQGTLHSDLIIYGRGDPSFAARFNGGDSGKSLDPLVTALVAAGIKRIEGDLVGDESFFRGPPFGSSWTWDDLPNYYGAEVSALSQEDNVVDLVFKSGAKTGDPCVIVSKPATDFLTFINRAKTADKGARREINLYRPLPQNTVYISGSLPVGTNWTDAVSVHNPALWFVTRLKSALEKRGIVVAGKSRSVNWLDRQAQPLDFSRLMEVASIESRPVSELVNKMMKSSQNLYAQLLLLQVGARSEKSDHQAKTTEEAGIAELNRFARDAGVRRGELLFDEGSGLSRSALVTPEAIVQLLVFMSRHRCAEVFRDALPIAGVDGSLRNRMNGTAAEKNVRAKTGTIGHVHSLSGYVTTAAGEHLAFSLMLNNYDADGRHSVKDDLDLIPVMLAEFKGRSDQP